MPNRNGQGPLNNGPMTGLGRGRCAGFNNDLQDNQAVMLPQRGAGQAYRRGQGGCGGLGRRNGGGRGGGRGRF